ncbi:MAG: glycosyltransferase family 2 protein [archaeon]|jgi:GalNAc5-diNAcBac-PP-undecaprenol beta-1,3-glucosyltransferase
MKTTVVSIIIPTRNRKVFLKEAIDSVLSQTYKNIELIITDDNSTDGTEEFVKDYLKNKKINYKFVKNKKYLPGPNGNKNNGFDYMTGELIAILDDDDKLFPQAIQWLVRTYYKTGYRQIIADQIYSSNNKVAGISNVKGNIITFKDVLTDQISGHFTGLFHKSLLGNKRFDDRQWGAECNLWWHFNKEEDMYYLNKTVYWYRIHQGSVCFKLDNIPRRIINYKNTIKDFSQDFLKYNPQKLGQSYFSLSLLYAIEKEYKNAKKSYTLSRKYLGFNVINLIKYVICLHTPRKLFSKLFNIKEKVNFYLREMLN